MTDGAQTRSVLAGGGGRLRPERRLGGLRREGSVGLSAGMNSSEAGAADPIKGADKDTCDAVYACAVLADAIDAMLRQARDGASDMADPVRTVTFRSVRESRVCA